MPAVPFGRDSIMDQINEALHSNNTVVAVEGIIGIGKSTIALAIARYYVNEYQRLPSNWRFDTIIYLSVKPTRWTPTGPQTLRLQPLALDDLHGAIAPIYHDIYDIPIPFVPGDDDENRQQLREALARMGRVLLVVDDLDDPWDSLDGMGDTLDTLDTPDTQSNTPNNKALRMAADLLARGAGGPDNKLLVTMRKDCDAVEDRIRVPLLDDDAMARAIAQMAQTEGLELSETERDRLVRMSRGLILAGYLAVLSTRAAGGNIHAAMAQVAEQFFRRTLGALLARLEQEHPAIFAVLTVLSYFDPIRGVTRDRIGKLLDLKSPIDPSGFDIDGVRKLLKPLLMLNLASIMRVPTDAPSETARYGVLATVQDYLDAQRDEEREHES